MEPRQVEFRTTRLNGRPPHTMALGLYTDLFGTQGEADLDRDIQDYQRHRIAPWVLRHAGHDVGIGGFRIGFGGDGLEVLFHFLPEVWGQGLASEFLISALDHARQNLREDRFFGSVAPDNTASRRVMEKVGFVEDGPTDTGEILLRLR